MILFHSLALICHSQRVILASSLDLYEVRDSHLSLKMSSKNCSLLNLFTVFTVPFMCFFFSLPQTSIVIRYCSFLSLKLDS